MLIVTSCNDGWNIFTYIWKTCVCTSCLKIWAARHYYTTTLKAYWIPKKLYVSVKFKFILLINYSIGRFEALPGYQNWAQVPKYWESLKNSRESRLKKVWRMKITSNRGGKLRGQEYRSQKNTTSEPRQTKNNHIKSRDPTFFKPRFLEKKKMGEKMGKKLQWKTAAHNIIYEVYLFFYSNIVSLGTTF